MLWFFKNIVITAFCILLYWLINKLMDWRRNSFRKRMESGNPELYEKAGCFFAVSELFSVFIFKYIGLLMLIVFIILLWLDWLPKN